MKTKAVFLDRDGVINREADNLRSMKQLHILPGVPEALRKLHEIGYLTIVITNQPVVARGWLSEAGVRQVHGVIAERVGRKGAVIDAFYYCPHHPNANLKKYRMKCACRKPNIGMIQAAQKKFKIDVKKSFLVGDSTRDLETGRRAKVRTILVKTGYAGKDGMFAAKPDFIAKDLLDALRVIKQVTHDK